MARHITFQQVICRYLSYNINADLDEIYIIDNIKWTLRDMILSITSSGVDTTGFPLFHMIDCTSNDNSQFFRGWRGPGGLCYIFPIPENYKKRPLQ